MTITDKTIQVEGLPVRYLDGGAGNGRAVLLLHGGVGAARANWSEVLPALEEQFHVIAPDLPGVGGSAALPEMSIEKLVGWLRALLDAFEQSEAVVLGAGAGALLARLFAAAEPQYVPAIILVNGGTLPQFTGLLPALANLPLVGNVARQLHERSLYQSQNPDRMIHVKEVITDDLRAAWRESVPGSAALSRALFDYDYPDKHTPPVPTLLLWGADDPLAPLADGERLKGEIPGAVLSPVADCGHMPQIEASDAFAFQVASFLDGLTRARQTNMPGARMLRSD
ncbi:MAG: alpha/beta hydrolase [Anaerolineae bacterium]|nr:alpha/beta hydrolase [Anaerolineae bacterium]